MELLGHSQMRTTMEIYSQVMWSAPGSPDGVGERGRVIMLRV